MVPGIARPCPGCGALVTSLLTPPGREAAGRVIGVVDGLEEHLKTRVPAGQLDAFHAVMAALEDLLP